MGLLNIKKFGCGGMVKDARIKAEVQCPKPIFPVRALDDYVSAG
jgi:hypothetical protein